MNTKNDEMVGIASLSVNRLREIIYEESERAIKDWQTNQAKWLHEDDARDGKIKCPKCNWGSTVRFLQKKGMFYCSHCRTEFPKPK